MTMKIEPGKSVGPIAIGMRREQYEEIMVDGVEIMAAATDPDGK